MEGVVTTMPASDDRRPAATHPIPIAGPWITDHEVALVADAVRTAWYDQANDVTAAFESNFADHVGRRHAVALPSCTSAIHLALAGLGVGPGDEVIVPDATWIASAAPISYVGATPVFADVDPSTWCIDVESVEQVMTSRTRAVIAVDLYGGLPEFGALQSLCQPRGVAVIEDAAEAIGSRSHGRLAGSFGAVSTFSFHGSKTMTTGEGGMLVTDDDRLYRRILKLRDHGREPGDISFFNDEIAFKYKMSALQAALGQAQLDRINDLIGAKRQIFSWYANRLRGHPNVTLNAEPAGTINSYWMSTVVVDPTSGSSGVELAKELASLDIATRPFFHPLSSLPAYRDVAGSARARQINAVSRFLAANGLNLPSALSLTRSDIDRVCDAVEQFIEARA